MTGPRTRPQHPMLAEFHLTTIDKPDFVRYDKRTAQLLIEIISYVVNKNEFWETNDFLMNSGHSC